MEVTASLLAVKKIAIAASHRLVAAPATLFALAHHRHGASRR
jgi:hypothetical protein